MAKKTFWQICKEYHLEKKEISYKAEVDIEVINRLFTYEPIAKDDAIKVLAVVSRLIGIRYSLDDVDVKLKK